MTAARQEIPVLQGREDVNGRADLEMAEPANGPRRGNRGNLRPGSKAIEQASQQDHVSNDRVSL